MKLVVLEGPATRDSFDIVQPRAIIGRAPDSDVLVSDAQVSRHHAQLTRSGDDYFIEGLQQTNPTIVNDRFVTGRRLLLDGDLIVVGSVLFEVVLPPPPRPELHGETQPQPPREDRRSPRPPSLPPPPPLDRVRSVAARLAAAGQRIQSRATARPSTSPVSAADAPAVEAIIAEHERLGGDAELARLAGLLNDRLSNQTDIRALYRLGAEAGALIAWSRVAQRSIEAATHLASVLGAH